MSTYKLIVIGEVVGGLVVLGLVGVSKLIYWWQWGAVDPFSDNDENGRYRYPDTPWWSRGHKGRKLSDPNRRNRADQ